MYLIRGTGANMGDTRYFTIGLILRKRKFFWEFFAFSDWVAHIYLGCLKGRGCGLGDARELLGAGVCMWGPVRVCYVGAIFIVTMRIFSRCEFFGEN